MKWILFIVLLSYSIAIFPAQTAELPETIYICDDISEWPPYIYFEREGNKKTDKIAGFSVDIINEILSPQNIAFEIRLLPWKRCLYEVEQGENFHILLDASYNEERAQKFHVSRAYYFMTPYYFYSLSHNPNGLDIQTAADLKKYRISGISGYNYTDYGLAPEDVNENAATHDPLVLQLHHNRCDLFPEWYEVMAGFAQIGTDYFADPNLGYAPVPDVPPTPFHIMFPKNDLGLKLKQIIDDGLDRLEASGRLQELLQQYQP